jgi:hypothetical protein
MLRNTLFPVLLVLVLGVFPLTALGGTAGTTVTITGTVDTFAEWDSATQTIGPGDFDGHITAVNQTRTATKTFKLYMNGNVSIAPTGGLNAGVLKDVTTSTYSLTTQYKITGSVGVPDLAYKAAGNGAGEFFNAGNTYAITHVGGTGSYDVIFSVQMISPAAAAPDADDYKCGVVLTATF